MTRGRKKDLTIPPTRSLTQQRDYRARKANYVSELETHCRKVEEENAELRKELADVRARLANPIVVLPETAQASQELLYSLAIASVSLTKFQQLAFPNIQQTTQTSFQSNQNAHGAYPSPPSNIGDTREIGGHPGSQPHKGRKRLFTESEEEFLYSPTVQAGSPSEEPTRSESSEESCCGGYIDCDTLCGDSIVEGKEQGETISRVSGMRSTFDYRVNTP